MAAAPTTPSALAASTALVASWKWRSATWRNRNATRMTSAAAPMPYWICGQSAPCESALSQGCPVLEQSRGQVVRDLGDKRILVFLRAGLILDTKSGNRSCQNVSFRNPDLHHVLNTRIRQSLKTDFGLSHHVVYSRYAGQTYWYAVRAYRFTSVVTQPIKRGHHQRRNERLKQRFGLLDQGHGLQTHALASSQLSGPRRKPPRTVLLAQPPEAC